ncbi:MAG: hypothetical protein B6I22_00340 [Desulfobacteraceae bacterium 4572_123]|nr:MAG: hypothetical protein B6I22_00340 [Desulfobacteraceae bacterium 4572_123]
MRIPSQKQCRQLIHKMKMMDHIVDHSCQVCRVALFLADHLIIQGIDLNRELIHAAAILHDITKSRSFETGEDHAVTGGRLLTEMGFPEVGDIIRQHVVLDSNVNDRPPGEAEIVNYADKRVRHDKIVSLEKRMIYILQRYGKSPEHCVRIKKLWRESAYMEKKLFDLLPFQPEDCCKINP